MLYALGILLWICAVSGAYSQLPPEFRTDLSKKSIQLEELVPGGPPKDGIPAIRRPRFESVDSAAAWLAPAEPVLVVWHAGQVRVYPLQILIWHELVNDQIGDLPVLASFCPLCNAAVVFDRRIDGVAAEFGVTGMLRHSDMVMFDRRTESLWQQLTGEAIVGTHTGKRLEIVASQVVPFRTVSESLAGARVLTRATGFKREYGTNPYVNYESLDRMTLPVSYQHSRSIKPLERLLTFRSASKTLGYILRQLRTNPVQNGGQRGSEYVVFYEPAMLTPLAARRIADSTEVGTAAVFSPIVDGERLEFESVNGTIVDHKTSSTWNLLGQATAGPLAGTVLDPIEHGVYYAFAWLAFEPQTQVLRLPDP